ncbi:hypothetical protein [Chitinophaga rhizophila]|uniref:Lipoprotein n=1 Tax=Chitinophaga rhizophila TaxID=2866212 RepID=A0ABS7G8F3_9BACT|nr:hypothetical protein [Chitinophaga rhizophila]MBW8683405.1 hypothetical protein [Chitinophaga rhizophila]
MKIRNITYLFALGFMLALAACTNPTPENYFDRAVLNTNIFNDFASENFTRDLIATTVKHEGVQGNEAPNQAQMIVDNKAQYIEKALKDIKALKKTDETKEMLETSIALHEYVLPVYKNEYTALAKLCDSGAAKDDIAALALEIDNKYAAQFEELFVKLTNLGKAYAKAHDINVSWGK